MTNPFFKNTGPYDINYLLTSINLGSQKFPEEKTVSYTHLRAHET